MDTDEPEEEHMCQWVKEYAILASEHNLTQRQLRACDASKRTMARNCQSNDDGRCQIDSGKLCGMQCGRRNAKIINGRLDYE